MRLQKQGIGVTMAFVALSVSLLIGCGSDGSTLKRSPDTGQRRTVTIAPGEERTYSARELRAGDTVVCIRESARLGAAQVPRSGTGVGAHGDGPAGSVAITIAVDRNESVRVACHE